MKIVGGLLIALSILTALSFLDFLAFAPLMPSLIGAYFSYAWPAGVLLIAGILVWRFKRKGNLKTVHDH